MIELKALPGAWEEYDQWEAGRSQGGGFALVSDSFSRLLLLVWHPPRQVAGQRVQVMSNLIRPSICNLVPIASWNVY